MSESRTQLYVAIVAIIIIAAGAYYKQTRSIPLWNHLGTMHVTVLLKQMTS